jgi:hypothetical protein
MSYLAMVKQAEAQRAEYREALRRWWSEGGDDSYQEAIRLMDELGVSQATVILDEALRRLAGPTRA